MPFELLVISQQFGGILDIGPTDDIFAHVSLRGLARGVQRTAQLALLAGLRYPVIARETRSAARYPDDFPARYRSSRPARARGNSIIATPFAGRALSAD